jgi:hypothetical protein
VFYSFLHVTAATAAAAAATAATVYTHVRSLQHHQEIGDSLTGAIRSLADALAAAAAAAAAAANSSSQDTLQQLLKPTDHKRMFMSMGGTYMLTYSAAAAATLHNVPLVMALSAPAVLKLLAPATVSLKFECCTEKKCNAVLCCDLKYCELL